MTDTPETIYLIQGEYDGESGLVWCDDPAPDDHCDPAEAVKYVRADVHEQAEARVAELSNLCERLQHCAQGFYVDQGDYGHMEAIMEDYHWIMRASKPWRESFKKRLRSEGVIDAHNAMSDSFVLEATGVIQERAVLRCQDFLEDYAQRLRQQADEAEREGGEQ